MGNYTRRNLASLVELYFLLRAIKRLAAEYKTELEKSSNKLLERIKANPPADEWAEPQQGGGSNSRQGMTRALSKLEQWDANDRINAYNKGVSNCDSSSLWQPDLVESNDSDLSDKDSDSPHSPQLEVPSPVADQTPNSTHDQDTSCVAPKDGVEGRGSVTSPTGLLGN
ncbi:unnamed protein product [Rhizoctonia solani]|uniref:Uncharacterized protein n=1 Tax=Rhizoctonia solani TaxID=456999 RepID=A0A8H3HYC9_9AGAM|nr:unnamed protein product [Rhizoctonia solani]